MTYSTDSYTPSESERQPASTLGQAFELAIGRIFSLTQAAGQVRGVIFWVSVFLTWFFTALWFHPWGDWSVRLFHLRLDPAASPAAMLLVWFDHLFGILLAGETLTRLIIFFLPVWLAHEIASIYLMDIFELPKTSISRDFISRAAFATARMDKLIINNEKLSRKQEDSPAIRIGGPCTVQVNVEYAAVFEKINGAFHPISPNLRIQRHEKSIRQHFTDFLLRYFPVLLGPDAQAASRAAGPNGTLGTPRYLPAVTQLDGFERLRSIIDLRDQTVSFNISARTSDGIHISVKNLRLIFSVWRGANNSSLGRPYPFRRQAIYWLTYQNVKGERWSQAMQTLVYEELVRFISEHTLGELLAAIGEPEIQRQLAMQKAIQSRILSHQKHSRVKRKDAKPQLPHRPKNYAKPLPLPYRERKHARRPRNQHFFSPITEQFQPAPNFIPRPQLSNFFREFASGFPERARMNGVHLEWIDIGSFSTNEEVILNQHVEAYRLTSENLARSLPRVLNELRNQSRNREIVRLLDTIPILSFVQLQKQNASAEDTISEIIGLYGAVLRSTRESLVNEGKPVPAALDNACAAIHRYQIDQTQSHRRGLFVSG